MWMFTCLWRCISGEGGQQCVTYCWAAAVKEAVNSFCHKQGLPVSRGLFAVQSIFGGIFDDAMSLWWQRHKLSTYQKPLQMQMLNNVMFIFSSSLGWIEVRGFKDRHEIKSSPHSLPEETELSLVWCRRNVHESWNRSWVCSNPYTVGGKEGEGGWIFEGEKGLWATSTPQDLPAAKISVVICWRWEG